MTVPATDELIATLKAGLKDVTPGPWTADTEKSGGCYGYGDECYEGYHTSTLLDADGRRIADALNCDAGMVQEEFDEAGTCYAWDEQAGVNFAHLARCSPDNIAAVLARLEAAEARVAALNHTVEQLHGPLSVAVLTARAEAAEAENKRLREALGTRPLQIGDRVEVTDTFPFPEWKSTPLWVVGLVQERGDCGINVTVIDSETWPPQRERRGFGQSGYTDGFYINRLDSDDDLRRVDTALEGRE